VKALYFDQKLSLRDLPTPEAVAKGEALIRVRLAGICNTDLEITSGYMGFQGVLGHEFVGEVVESPDGSLMGERVVGEINAGCGECRWCRADMARHCPNRTVLGILNRDGAFAEFVSLPVVNLYRVPDGIPDEQAVFVEPLAAAMEIQEQLQIEPRHRVSVFGDGKLGLLIAMALRLTGCEITLVGKHPKKMRLVESLGVVTREVTSLDDERFDLVVEATGSPEGLPLAVKHTEPRGTVVLKTTSHAPLQYNTAPIVIDEITIVGSRCGRFKPALRVLDRGLIDPRPLIEQILPFDRALAAFEVASRPGSLKILLDLR
jgi:threonine dehydrogenase-like Zn-dependent dehydrogenase